MTASDVAMRVLQAAGTLRALAEGQDGDTQAALELVVAWLRETADMAERLDGEPHTEERKTPAPKLVRRPRAWPVKPTTRKVRR
jgi:hypothetical protein